MGFDIPTPDEPSEDDGASGSASGQLLNASDGSPATAYISLDETDDPADLPGGADDGAWWLNLSDLGSPDAANVTFDDTGLIVITGVGDVEAALALVDAELAGLDAAYAPKDLAGVLVSASVILTDGYIPNNLTYEQWGTDEAVIPQADCPVNAVVVALLSGGVGPNTGGSPAVGDRGQAKLQVSFDGGGSFADFAVFNEPAIGVQNATSSNNTVGFSAHGRGTGTVTGDIQVRAMCRDVTQANDTQFRSGMITVFVHPQ